MPAVVDRALEAYVAASPHYHGSVPEHLHRHMAHTCRELGRLFLRMMRERRDPGESELTLFRDRARERAEDGLPAVDFLDAYFVFGETLWAELVKVADGAVPDEAARTLLRCLHCVLHVALEAHQGELLAGHTEERGTVRELVRALVAGEPLDETANRSEIRLTEANGVLALRFGTGPVESVGDALGRRLAGQRKVRLVAEHLRRALGEEALASLDPRGGLVLLPCTPHGSAPPLATARSVVPKLWHATGIEVTGGYAYAPSRQEIPAAAAQARRLLELDLLPGTVAVLDEYLVEYHLHHDSDAIPSLAAISAALRAEADLLDTVTTYFATDFNRGETARRLQVHPNTVDNRMARVATVTGADPRTARGVLLLSSALLCAR